MGNAVSSVQLTRDVRRLAIGRHSVRNQTGASTARSQRPPPASSSLKKTSSYVLLPASVFVVQLPFLLNFVNRCNRLAAVPSGVRLGIRRRIHNAGAIRTSVKPRW